VGGARSLDAMDGFEDLEFVVRREGAGDDVMEVLVVGEVGWQAGGCAGAAAGFVAADYAAGFRRWMRVCHGGGCDVCSEILELGGFDGWGGRHTRSASLLKVSN
jgi:hypothetical protein